jgi:hypothetical protein
VLAGLVDRVLRHRRRFPRALNRAIDYVADHPGGFLGRLVARRMGLPEPGPAIVLTAPAAPIRVLIGPVNYSGQGRLWATSLERSDSRIAARNVALDVPGGFSFPADLVVPVPVYHNSRQWQAEQLRAIRGFSHVLVEAEEPLLGRMFQRDVAAEVAQFTAAGLSVAFISHGTDIRLPSRHITTTRWSPYLDRDMYVDRLERLAVEVGRPDPRALAREGERRRLAHALARRGDEGVLSCETVCHECPWKGSDYTSQPP